MKKSTTQKEIELDKKVERRGEKKVSFSYFPPSLSTRESRPRRKQKKKLNKKLLPEKHVGDLVVLCVLCLHVSRKVLEHCHI